MIFSLQFTPVACYFACPIFLGYFDAQDSKCVKGVCAGVCKALPLLLMTTCLKWDETNKHPILALQADC